MISPPALANPPSSSGLDHEPALDGMRAVAVVVVLLFHADVPWMRGGYIGVSVFFTLSGFLITRLLLAEHARTGRIALGPFYARRLRRLLPASLACILGVVAAAWLGWFTPTGSLRREVAGAVLQVANWENLSGSDSYADLLHRLGGPASPLAHYWSLAIEEQFYWLWPPVLLALFIGRPSPGALARRIGAVTLGSAVLAVWIAVRFGPDAAYWSTPARAGEILVGAALAASLRVHPVRPGAAALGPPALAIIVVAAIIFPNRGGPAYMGLMPVFALVERGADRGVTDRRTDTLAPAGARPRRLRAGELRALPVPLAGLHHPRRDAYRSERRRTDRPPAGHDGGVGDGVVRSPGVADPPAGVDTSIHRRTRPLCVCGAARGSRDDRGRRDRLLAIRPPGGVGG